MSIKSQKSLNEECSEIWEKSYSVRTPSIESFSSIEDECQRLSQQLLSALTPAILSQLRRKFTKRRPGRNGVARKVQQVMKAAAAVEGIDFGDQRSSDDGQLWIDEEKFVSSLESIFGHHKYTVHAHKLFQLLDPYMTGLASWGNLLDRMIEVGAKKTRSRAEAWVKIDEGTRNMKKLPHCKREPLVKLVSILRPESYCCVAVTRGGRVGLYCGKLNLLHTYEIWYHRRGSSNRVKNCWVTDALYLEDAQSMVYSASDRSFSFFDASTLIHTPTFYITGVPNIPTCMTYVPSISASSSSELWFGDEHGDVTSWTFHRPRVCLLHSSRADGVNHYFWMELTSPPHTSTSTINQHRDLHTRMVCRLLRHQASLLSCSSDTRTSVRWRRVDGKIQDYTWGNGRGIICLDYSSSLRILASGSSDGIIRLHSPRAPPHAILRVGTSAVRDVRIVSGEEILVAVHQDCTVNIWDVFEECLLQTIRLKFPFLGVLGRKAEFGPYAIHEGDPRKVREDNPEEYCEPTSASRADCDSRLTNQNLLTDDDDPKQSIVPHLYISCGEYIHSLHLSPAGVSVPPAPVSTARSHTPRGWPEISVVGNGILRTSSPPPSRSPRPSSLLYPPQSSWHNLDVDELCERAGLQGLLEKDFVQMMGLKQDLNKKLANLQADMAHITSRVSLGAPHLACTLHDPEPFDETPYKI